MDNIKWDDIYIQLYAYADQLLKTFVWFRKTTTDSYLKGKQPHDYAAEAIEKYLSAPEKYDSSTGRSLVTYLKWHIIRTAVGNDVRSKENRSSSDLLSRNNSEDSDDFFINTESFFPFLSASFDDDIDYKSIMDDIDYAIKDDQLIKLIFNEVRIKGYDRRDVIKQHQLNESDFDNGMKRLKTILKKVIKQYNL